MVGPHQATADRAIARGRFPEATGNGISSGYPSVKSAASKSVEERPPMPSGWRPHVRSDRNVILIDGPTRSRFASECSELS
jgi:hypothetical protein